MNDTITSTEKNINPLEDIPIEITISVGKSRPKIKDLLHLEQDAVLELDKRIDDMVDLFVGNRLIARGELQELPGDQNGQLAVRLTEIINLQDCI